METQAKKQTQEKNKIAAVIMADKYMGFNIPLIGYREASIVMPKIFTPAEAEAFKQLIMPIIDGIYDHDDGLPEEYERPDVVVSMFLTGINVKDIGTEREIMRTPHSVKISKEKVAYISIPDCLDLEEIKAIEQYVAQICEHYITNE